MPLLQFTDRGIYCKQAGIYIDPWKPVDKALITHGHADHARYGHGHYLCHHHSKPVLQLRLGTNIEIQTVTYHESINVNGVAISFHPAGHIIGSAQIRLEYKGCIWVVSGDYKIEDDGLSGAFEPVKCHYFITECTFGLPVYKWRPQKEVFDDINHWWQKNKEADKTTVIIGYSLGKAQRIIQGLDTSIGPILTHGAVENINQALRNDGVSLNETIRVTADFNKNQLNGSIVVAPPSAAGTTWMKKFHPYSIGIASGWMGLRGARRRRSVDRGFVLSDHADWIGLNQAINESGAEYVIATHGYTNAFARWLNEKGIQAGVESTMFEGELSEINEGSDGKAVNDEVQN